MITTSVFYADIDEPLKTAFREMHLVALPRLHLLRQSLNSTPDGPTWKGCLRHQLFGRNVWKCGGRMSDCSSDVYLNALHVVPFRFHPTAIKHILPPRHVSDAVVFSGVYF